MYYLTCYIHLHILADDSETPLIRQLSLVAWPQENFPKWKKQFLFAIYTVPIKSVLRVLPIPLLFHLILTTQ